MEVPLIQGKGSIAQLIITTVSFLMISIAMGAEKRGGHMTEDIHWLGHDTFKIKGEISLYTDPFRLKRRDVADIILITHDHHDHCSPEDIKRIQGPDTIIVATADCAKKLSGKVVTVCPGEKITAAGVSIEAVPAYNTDKQFHTKDRGWVGYIFTIASRRIYLAGDTDYIPEMKTFGDIDIALLPVSGTYVMTADEAVRAALDIMPKLAIPMHYGSIVGSQKDAEIFKEQLRGKVEVIVLPAE
jgi:L-ascorbate metabolism protein UlaG (beta-lactamase superfamily)